MPSLRVTRRDALEDAHREDEDDEGDGEDDADDDGDDDDDDEEEDDAPAPPRRQSARRQSLNASKAKAAAAGELMLRPRQSCKWEPRNARLTCPRALMQPLRLPRQPRHEAVLPAPRPRPLLHLPLLQLPARAKARRPPRPPLHRRPRLPPLPLPRVPSARRQRPSAASNAAASCVAMGGCNPS